MGRLSHLLESIEAIGAQPVESEEQEGEDSAQVIADAVSEFAQRIEKAVSQRSDNSEQIDGITKAITQLGKAIKPVKVAPPIVNVAPANITVEAPNVEVLMPENEGLMQFDIKRDDNGQMLQVIAGPCTEPKPKPSGITIE